MSNKINFKIYTGPKKGQAQPPKQQAEQKPKKTAAASKPAPVAKVNKEEEEKKRLLEEERKALLANKKAEFEKAAEKELDEEGKSKAEILQGLFKLDVLAKVPEYTSYIMNNATIRYEDLLKIPDVAKICSSWTDVVTLVKYCDNLKYVPNDFDSALVNHNENVLFPCIAKIACQLSELPENMSTGDLRMILGAKPLMITKTGATTAQVLFREGIVAVSMFFKTKTMSVKEMVDGQMKVVKKPFNINSKLLKPEDKEGFYNPQKVIEANDDVMDNIDDDEEQ